MKTKIYLISLFVIVSILLTACSIGITTKVNADGSGELGFVYKFTEDELSQLGTYGLSKDTICTDMQEQGEGMPADFTFKQESHGDEIWCVGAKQFDTLAALKGELGGEGFNIKTMEISGGKFTFDADADMSSTDTGGMPFSISVTYDLTAPGKIDQDKSNADSYDGNTATWNLSLGNSKGMYLESNTSGGGGGFEFKLYYVVILACCCLLVILVIAVAVYFFMKQQKQKQQATQFVPPA